MNIKLRSRKTLLAAGGAAALVALAVGGSAYALTSDDDNDSDRPIPAADLEQAEEAALAETGEGKVTDTEVDDEESKYEVEVTLDDGTEVDVQLDESFAVVSSETDGPDGTDDDHDDDRDDD